MYFSQTLQDVLWALIDSDWAAGLEAEIGPSAFEDVGERQKTHAEVLVGKRQSPDVSTERCVIHPLGEHDAFADACSPASVEDVDKVVLFHFGDVFLDFFAVVFAVGESKEFLEVEADVVLWVFPDRRVEDDESLHVMLNLEHTVGRVVLVLLANKDVSNLGVADHVLDLRLARRGIERDSDRPDAIGAEVHIHTLRHVLREDGDVFLYADTQFQQRCRHTAHCLCKFFPRDAFPSLLVVVAVKHGGTFAIDFGLALDKRGNWTWVLHSDSFFDMAKIRIN